MKRDHHVLAMPRWAILWKGLTEKTKNCGIKKFQIWCYNRSSSEIISPRATLRIQDIWHLDLVLPPEAVLSWREYLCIGCSLFHDLCNYFSPTVPLQQMWIGTTSIWVGPYSTDLTPKMAARVAGSGITVSVPSKSFRVICKLLSTVLEK